MNLLFQKYNKNYYLIIRNSLNHSGEMEMGDPIDIH